MHFRSYTYFVIAKNASIFDASLIIFPNMLSEF